MRHRALQHVVSSFGQPGWLVGGARTLVFLSVLGLRAMSVRRLRGRGMESHKHVLVRYLLILPIFILVGARWASAHARLRTSLFTNSMSTLVEFPQDHGDAVPYLAMGRITYMLLFAELQLLKAD